MFLVMHKPKHPIAWQDRAWFVSGWLLPILRQFGSICSLNWAGLPWQRRAFRSTFDKWFAQRCNENSVGVLPCNIHRWPLMFVDVMSTFFWALCSIRSEFLWLPLQMGTADADLAYLKKEALRCCSLGLLWLEAPSSACSACAVEHVFFLQQTQDEPLSTRQHMQ